MSTSSNLEQRLPALHLLKYSNVHRPLSFPLTFPGIPARHAFKSAFYSHLKDLTEAPQTSVARNSSLLATTLGMLRKSHFKYPGMSQKRPPIFRKAWDLIALSIPIEKLQKPIKQNLLTFKRARKNKRKLLKYYDYAFIEEFQFSPSSTPLFHHYKGRFKKTGTRSLSSMFLLCHCAGTPTIEGFDAAEESIDPIVEDAFSSRVPELTYSSDESESVDRKAERFIARFYEDMRMQREASMLQ